MAHANKISIIVLLILVSLILVSCSEGNFAGQASRQIKQVDLCEEQSDCIDDGNLCNGEPFCNTNIKPATCELIPSTVIKCESGFDTECKKNLCESSTGECGFVFEPEGTSCDDGDKFTGNDQCDGKGECYGLFTGECQDNSDCKDDENLCNGAPFCNKKIAKCEPIKTTIVNCPHLQTETSCMKNLCQPSTGECLLQNVAEGMSCDDGEGFTKDDVCVSGVCKGTPFGECRKNSDCIDKDNNLCDGKMFCDKSTYKCVNNPATIVTCQTIEDTDCVNNTCNPLTGKCKLQNAKDGLICEDGDKLTMGDTCVGGVCKGIFSGECRNNSDCKDEDNDLCTGTPYCDKATAKCVLNPITVVTCQTVDDTACLKNTCQPSTGECQFKTVNEGGICSDFNLCTFGDVCQLGKCVGKEVVC